MPLVSWQEHQRVGQFSGINDDGTLRTATALMHCLGELLHFSGTVDAELQDTVFLAPSFLVDMMKYVIRHDHDESLRFDGLEEAQQNRE